MKNNRLVLIFLAAAAWLLLPACRSNSDKDATLRAPETTQVDTTASTTNPEKASGKDDEADDDDENEDKAN